MALNIEKEVAALQRMSVAQLRVRYAEVFGERPRSGHRVWLLRRIAWRIQALAYGEHSERARHRALELANDADLRLTPPRGDKLAVSACAKASSTATTVNDRRLPMPGTLITRKYKGRTLVVEMRDDGFAFDGRVFPSLSAVAKAATGAHWNGFHFFGLVQKATSA